MRAYRRIQTPAFVRHHTARHHLRPVPQASNTVQDPKNHSKKEILDLRLALMMAVDRQKQQEAELNKTIQEVGRAAYGAKRAVDGMQAQLTEMQTQMQRLAEGLKTPAKRGPKKIDPLVALGLK